MFGDAFKNDDDVSDPKIVSTGQGENESEEEEEEEEEAPLLFVDVNLGPNDQRRIVVYEGDDARQLAEQFCIENDLDDDTMDKLESLLEQQIAAVLSKIDEDDDAVSDDQVEGEEQE